MTFTKLFLITLFLINQSAFGQSGLCTPNTPFFQVNLAGSPNGTWTSTPPIARDGFCCGSANPDRCIEFEITLDPSAVAINFQIASGAIPPGSMYYQIGCGPLTQVGQPLCLTGSGPHILTFCKPGNNVNTYSITSYSNPYLGPDAYTTQSCAVMLNAYGVDTTTITWNDITSGTGAYNSFLSCTNCVAPLFTAQSPYPPFIDYKVCAMPIAAVCNSAPLWCDTIRVYLAPPLTVSASSVSYCANEAGVLLSANVTGGAPPYSYFWANSTGTVVSNSSTYFASTPGNYTFEVRDTLFNRCGSKSAIVNVTMNPLPTVLISPASSTICAGGSTSLTASGGTTYNWSDGSTSSTITVSPSSSTNYIVTVTNTYGCTNIGNINVTVNSLPVPNAGADQTICQGQSALISVTGGSTYQWNNGSTASSINVSPSGTTTYTVTATSNGCTASDNVTVNINPLPSVNAGPDQTICQGQSINITATGGNSYQWSNGASGSSVTVSPTSTSNYSVTATNSFGCTAVDNITINVNSAPLANAGADQTICQGQVLTITASGGNSYLWNTGTGTSSIVVSPVSSATYSVTATASNGCTASDDVNVYVNSAPNAYAGPDQTICFGQTATLTASGGSTYLWNIGSSSSSVSITPSSTSTYTVTVTSGNGCSATDDVSIIVNPLPNANAGLDQTICLGQTATITASGGSAYQWNSGSSSASASVSPTSTSTYIVTVTNNYGCTSTDNVVVNVNPLPAANAGSDQMLCEGQSTVLTATGGATYLWNNGSGSASITVSPNASISFTVIVTGNNGCTASDLVTVYVNTLPVPNAGPDQSVCLGSNAVLNASGGSSYLWSNGVSASAINVSPVSTTTYVVTVTSGNGCTATDDVKVTVNPLPVAYASSDQTICLGQSTTITASGGSSYLWNNGSSSPSNSVNPSVTTTYSVTVTASNSCTASDNVVISVNPLPTVYAGPDQTLCQGQSVTITASGGSSYVWSNGSTSQNISVSPSSTGNYTVTAYNNGCSASDNVSVFVNTLPAANAGPDQSICQGQSANIIASGGTSYNWNTGGTSNTILVIPFSTAIYTVTVGNINGCTASDNVIITVNPLPAAYAGVDQTICQGQAASISASGGTSYSWNTGASTAAINVSPSVFTTYNVTVTNTYGCSASDNIVVNVNPSPNANAGSDQTICQGQTTTITATGGVSYNWNTGTTTSTINVSPAITTTYTVTVANIYGCIATDDIKVNVNPLPLANAGPDQNICPYQNTSLSASGGTSYVWNTGSTASSINISPGLTTTYTVTVTQNGCQATDAVIITVNPLAIANAGPDYTICPGQTAIITATAAGSYLWSNGSTSQIIAVAPALTTIYTLTVSSGGCSSTDDVVVNLATTLVASAGSDQIICSGETATITATGGSSYSWNTGASSATINVSPITATTYSVTTTSGGCSASDEISIIVNASPTANAGPNLSVCEGDFVTLSASGGTTYLWSNGSNASSQIIQPNSSANYYVTVTNTNGCTASDDISINVNFLPIVNAGPDQMICYGQPTTLNVSGGSTYTWSNGSNGQSISVSPLTTTNYIVTAFGSNGCSSTDNVSVIVNPLPFANAGPDRTICFGQNVSLTASLGTSYLWDNGASSATISISPPASSTYSVTVTNSAGCTATDDVNVYVNSIPIANAGFDQTICLGATANITASGGTSFQWNNGVNSVSISVSPTNSTTYIVTVGNAAGCTSTDDVTVNINNLPSANAGIDQTICYGQTANLNASGGINYSWSTGDLVSVISVNPSGSTNYTVTVTNTNGCSASDLVSVFVNPLPIANAGSDQTICFGQQATLTAGSGASYQWTTGSANASIIVSPVSSSLYIVTVTSSNGCTASDDITVFVNSLPLASAGADQSICFGNTANISASGGNFYQWSNGSVNQAITVSPYSSTNYIVTVTNSSGCSASDDIYIFINALPTAYAGPDQTICAGQSTGLVATGGASYLWSNGSVLSSINVSPASNFTYQVTVTNSNGCSAIDDVTVFVNPVPIADAGFDQTICFGQSATLNASGGSTYQWSNGSGTPSINVNPSASTLYSVIVSNNSGCTATDDVSIFVNSLPTVYAGADQTICQGVTANLNASGGASYSWNTGSNNSSINVSPSITSVYSVTATSSNGCSASDDIVVFVNNIPNAYAGIDQTICFGQSAVLSASGGSSYEWSTGSFSSIINVSPTISTTYFVTVYNNGCTALDDITVNINPAPIANAGPDKTICRGSSTTLFASGGFYYQWDNGQNAPNISVSPASSTTYIVTVTGSNGCPATDDAVVFVNPLPPANAGTDQIICFGQSTTLNASGGNTYIWNNGNLQPSISVSPTATSTYSVTVSDNNGCSASDDIIVTVNNTPIANAGPDKTICYGQSVSFTASGGSSYLWNTGNAISTLVTMPQATTTYFVTVTSTNGCTASDDVVANVNPTPIANAGNDQILCQGQSAAIYASGGSSYLWNTGTTSQSTTVTPASTTNYTVTVTQNGCTASDDILVIVNLPPSANAGPDKNVCYGDSVQLSASGGSFYQWNTGANTPNITVTPLSTTQYFVTVTGNNGCIATDDVTAFLNNIPVPDAGTDQTICAGQNTTLTATGGVSYVWSNGTSNNSIVVNPTSASSYIVTVTGLNGCTSSDDVTVYINALPIANAGPDQTICSGSQALLIASGGSSYLWNTSDVSSTIVVNPQTTTPYIVTVTSGNGCTAQDAVIINVISSPSANAGADQTICYGQSTTITASGGYAYLWDNGNSNTSQVVSPTLTTSYIVTVTGNNGCTAADETVVNVTTLPQPQITDTSICFGQQATLTASAGSIFTWNNGSTNSSITVAPATSTTYSVTVTENGCTNYDQAIVTVNPLPAAFAGSNQSICNGESLILNATGGTNYEWNTGGLNASIIVNPNTNSNFIVTVTDINGCSASDDVSITVNPIPSANAGLDMVICQGQSANLSASGGINYLWSNGANTSVINVSPPFTSNYIVTVSNGFCSATDDINVTVNALPVANAGPDATICTGDTAFLIGSGGISYNWSNGAGTSSNPVSPAITSVYSLTVTTNGCSSSDDVSVNILTPNIAISPATPTICSGDSITLTASGATNYTWSPSAGLNTNSGSSVIASPNVTTVYTLTASNSLCTAVKTITVYVNPLPLANAGPDQAVCNGTTALLVATGGTSYQWSNGIFNDSTFVLPSSTTLYSVTATLNGCTASDIVNVTVNPIPQIIKSPNQIICQGGSVQIFANGGTAYLWSTGSINDSIFVAPTTNTTYYFTITGSNGCTAKDSIMVMVNVAPPANAGSDQTICVGNSATLTATGGTEYDWNSGDTTATITVTPAFTLPYIVTVTGHGCTSTDEVIVIVVPLPEIIFNPNTAQGCPPLTVTFSNNTSPSGLTYFWNFGDGTTSIVENPVHTFDLSGYYDIGLMAYDTNGCTSTSQVSSMIYVFPDVNAEFTFTPQSLSTIDPTVNFIDQSNSASYWNWNFGDTASGLENTSIEQFPIHEYANSGTYTIWLIATNSFGCSDTAKHNINVKDPVSFYVPNAFTPNGDGVNDFFFPVGLGIDPAHFQMVIFDRWGAEIFETTDLNSPWDGKVNGSDKKCQIGVYVWLIKYQDIYGNENKVNGRVTLIR